MHCSDPKHQPTFTEALPIGEHKNVCPTCGYEMIIVSTTVFPPRQDPPPPRQDPHPQTSPSPSASLL